MKKTNNDKKNNSIVKKRLKIIGIICLSIILIELIIMYFIHLNRNSDIIFIDTLNSVHGYDNYYIASGSSNFYYSNYHDSYIYEYHDDINKDVINRSYAEQAKLVSYDKELNLVFESTFKCDYDSTFYDAIMVNDSIYAVGSYVYEEKQISLNTRDGLLVKYDLNGHMIWFKNYQVLGDTELKKIIAVDDGIIVVGQSIYENYEVGNHNMGGGIIIKYDFDGEIIWTNNWGGNKSGIFNDVKKVEDGYIAVGRDAYNYGMIVKFSLDGDFIWVKNYENTDTNGMTDIEIKDDKMYIAGSYNKSNETTEEGNKIYDYDACIFVYDLNGNYITLYPFGGSDTERFNSLILLDDSIVAVGYTMSSDIPLNKLNYQEKMSEGMIVKFDYEGNIINSKVYSGSKNETLSDISLAISETKNLINGTNNYIIVGYTNSKRGLFKGNNKDYFAKIINYDSELSIVQEK